jgi:RHS repeat-associated protein
MTTGAPVTTLPVSSSTVLTPVAPVVLSSLEERTYDGAGVLVGVKTTSESGVVRNVSLGWDPLAGSSQLAGWSVDGAFTSFVNGPQRREVAVGPTGVSTRFVYDALGNTVNGFAAGSAYDAFGRPVTPSSDVSVGGLAFGLNGELTVNGLTHLRARDYDPSLGQFLTVDPLESPAGSVTGGDPYHYVGNDPLNYSDPSGMGRVCDGGTGNLKSITRQWGCENPMAEFVVNMIPGVNCLYSLAQQHGVNIVLMCVVPELGAILGEIGSAAGEARMLSASALESEALPGLEAALSEDVAAAAMAESGALAEAEALAAAESEIVVAGETEAAAAKGLAAEGDAAAVQGAGDSAGSGAASEVGEAGAAPGEGGGVGKAGYGQAPGSQETPIYRGIHEGHNAYPDAVNGVASPGDVNGVSDVALHNAGFTHGTDLTSWTTNESLAEAFAAENVGAGSDGLALETTLEELRRRGISILTSPDAHGEAEILVKGVVGHVHVRPL